VSCPEKTFSSIANTECEDCTSDCKKCDSAFNCLECNLPLWTFVNYGICKASCDEKDFFKWNDNKCYECTSPCTKCADFKGCVGCKDGYHLESGKCVEHDGGITILGIFFVIFMAISALILPCLVRLAYKM